MADEAMFLLHGVVLTHMYMLVYSCTDHSINRSGEAS